MLLLYAIGIICLGLITSYEDIKIGKIRNKWIVLTLAYSLFANIIFFSINFNIIYLLHTITNIIFGIITGFIFWYMGVWTAGDGKLFIAFVSLVPINNYNVGYYPYIPSLTLLINIFIPSAFCLMIFALTKINMKILQETSKKLIKEIFNKKNLAKSIITLFSLYWVTELILKSFNIGNSIIPRYAITIILFAILEKRKNKITKISTYIVATIRLVVDKKVYSWYFVKNFIILVFIWKLFRSFLKGSLLRVIQNIFSKEIKVKNLKQGMKLSDSLHIFDKDKHTQDTIIKYEDKEYVIRPKD